MVLTQRDHQKITSIYPRGTLPFVSEVCIYNLYVCGVCTMQTLPHKSGDQATMSFPFYFITSLLHNGTEQKSSVDCVAFPRENVVLNHVS